MASRITSGPVARYLKKYPLLILVAVITFLLFYNLDSWSVTETSEARYAQISKEMVETGDYLHPRLMGIKHYHKPPFTYWITALSYYLFGISAFSARFFLQIAIILQVLLVYSISAILFKDRKISFIAAVIYFSLPGVIMAGRALTTDAYLCTFILLSVYSWFRFLKNNQTRFLLLFYLSIAMGFLTKGPVVFIFPIMVIIGARIGKMKPGRNLTGHLAGIVIFTITGLGWFIYLYARDTRFLQYFLLNHTVERFATDVFERGEPWWFYFVVVPLSSLPWSAVLITCLLRQKDRWSGELKYTLLFWIVAPFIFFSLSSSKLILYMLPVYAGIAIASAWSWNFLQANQVSRWATFQLIYQLTLLVALLLIPLFDGQIIISREIYLLTGIFIVLLVSFWRYSKISRVIPVLSAALFTGGLIMIASWLFAVNPSIANDTRRVAGFINNNKPEASNIFVYDRRLPSIQFHSDINIVSLYNGSRDLNREVQFEESDDWKDNLVDLTSNPAGFNELLDTNSVLIVRAKTELPGNFREHLLSRLSHQVVIDKYRIYY